MKRLLYIALILLGFDACVEPYDFEVRETDEVMVVDAVLTNVSEHHTVRLSISYALDGEQVTNVSGATVSVEEVGGMQYAYTEVEAGVYESDLEYAGVPGHSYILHVELNDGNRFVSSEEFLPSPVPIDSIYGRYLEQNSQVDESQLKGVQFMVDNHNNSEEFSSYRYEYREDYEVKVPYPSSYEWLAAEEVLELRETYIGTCYRFLESNELIAETTSGQVENRLSEFPIVYIEDNEAQLRYTFSLIVDQFSITPGAYQYYKNLKENNESAGSFFDKQKGTVLGNMSHVSDASYPILGYFEVAGVSTDSRVFRAGSFRDQGFSPIQPYNCIYDRVADSVAVEELPKYSGLGFSYEVYQLTFPSPDTAIIITSTCSDCRKHGTLDKPDFWDQ